MTVEDKRYYFDVIDYTVFSSMLMISAVTGLYFGCGSKYCNSVQSQNLTEYLTGNKKMKPFPVAMSLVGSYISGVTILGTPTEIYHYGTQYGLIAISVCISSCIVAFVYLPVLFRLQVNSSYEYLEMRFSREVRSVASVLFVFDEIMFLPIVIYVPSLAFNQVTGINVHIIGSVVCFICIFYTVLGGLKAVVYTDAWQIVVMFLSVIIIVIYGTVELGGFSNIFQIADEGKRLAFFNFNPSMYERHTFFSVLTGGVMYWTAFNSVNQTMVQRYLSVPTEKESKIAILIFTVGVSLFVTLCVFSGLLVYATYANCDPLSAGRIKREDQLLPLYVMETVGSTRGLPGLFIAGVFGAALSSLSVIMNSTAAVILEDFVKGCMRIHMNEKAAHLFVKVVVLTLGAMSIGFIFIVEHMGGVLAAATSLSSIAAGTTFGMFTLGMLIPWSTTVGTVIGAIAGYVMSGVVAFGSQYSSATKQVFSPQLRIDIDECSDKYGVLANITNIVYPDQSDIFPLFRLSYHWITPIGITTTVLVGTIASLIIGKNDVNEIDPELISPVAQWMLPLEAKRNSGTASKRIRDRIREEEDVALMNEVTTPEIINK